MLRDIVHRFLIFESYPCNESTSADFVCGTGEDEPVTIAFTAKRCRNAPQLLK